MSALPTGLHLPIQRRRIVVSLLSLGLLHLLCATISLRVCGAQEELTADARDQLYKELFQEVELLERRGNLLKKVVRLVKPTVVHIEAKKIVPQGQKASDEAGSGVIIQLNRRHFVLTNRHVVKDSNVTGIKIRLSDGRVLFPRQMWSDRATDVAVLEVVAERLVPSRLGNSDRLEIGDFVLAVGSPFGLSHSVTYGIISAKGRRDLRLGNDDLRFQDFMQTDAAINPGNSGGPLLNMRGEVVGINTAIASSSGGNEGIGFTIPINMVMIIARQLVEKGKVERAFLGVNLDSRFGPTAASRLGLSRPQGARVSGITPRSPAEAAKIQVGDVILEFNSKPIEDDSHLVNMVSLTPIGTDVPLVLLRAGKRLRLTVRVGKRSQFEGPSR